jgi:ADP-dependent NAD(P)H-hydrate dehydratase / NAD(P)H-hydrate epimerase
VKIVSSEAMTRIDHRSQAEFAIPSMVLMEDAGVKAWAALRREVWRGRRPRGRLVVAAGKGNNGGDAFVMARQAAVEGFRLLSIVLAGGRAQRDTDPGRNLASCEALGIEVIDWPVQQDQVMSRLGEASWILDGISGTGLRGALRPPLSDLVRAINQAPGRKAALDVPSGVGDGFRQDYPAVRADVTLTMGLPKLCLYLPRARALCGRILVIPVGFPPSLVQDASIAGELLGSRAWKELAPPIPLDTHKNRRGHLAVFAGSPGTTGAAVLCATAAARARVGLVTLYADREAYPVLAPRLTSVMCRPWDPARPDEGWQPARHTALLAGPGWGLGKERAAWLESLLSLSMPGVLDADALTLLGGRAASAKVNLGGRWVLTPHPGEFSKLTGAARDAVLDDPVGHALAASARLNAVVVLKGHTTVIANTDGRYWILDGTNPALATGGSGDVLAGLIAGGIAGGLAPLEAARFGVSLHARVGLLAARRRGWFLAEDLVPLISRVLWK